MALSYSQETLSRLFGISEETEEEKTLRFEALEKILPGENTRVLELDIDSLTDFPNQPFKPYTAEKLAALEASIRENGIINPLIVRRVEDKYQIVCGHNRRTAAAQAGFFKVPCIIKELSEDEAEILMVESNLLSRSGLMPSEKAFAYKMKMDAIRRQGQRVDLTSRHDAERIASADVIGQEAGESGRQIQRYIRLTELIPELLDLVDEKKLAFLAGVSLSYLATESQKTVHQYFFRDRNLSIDTDLAECLRELGQAGTLTAESINTLLNPAGAPPRPFKKVSVSMKPIKKYFPPTATAKEVEDIIVRAVAMYFQNQDKEV